MSESTPSGTGSAFQPVPRKVTFDSTTQDMNPQEMLELQHKVSILEAENKRLQVRDTNMHVVRQTICYCNHRHVHRCSRLVHAHTHNINFVYTDTATNSFPIKLP